MTEDQIRHMNSYERELYFLKLRSPFQIGDRFLMDFDGRIVEYRVTNIRLHSMRQSGGMTGRTYTVQTGGKGTQIEMTEARLTYICTKYRVAILENGALKSEEERDFDFEVITDADAEINPKNPANGNGGAA